VRGEPLSADLVLVPEVDARRLLQGRRIRLRVLAPYGSWVGCGRLRVLRLTQGGTDEEVELTVGYEAYQS
jgi:hypothetical protein